MEPLVITWTTLTAHHHLYIIFIVNPSSSSSKAEYRDCSKLRIFQFILTGLHSVSIQSLKLQVHSLATNYFSIVMCERS